MADTEALQDVTGLLDSLGATASGVETPLADVASALTSLRSTSTAAASAVQAVAKANAATSKVNGLAATEQAANKLISKKGAIKDTLGADLGNLSAAAKAAGGPVATLANKIEGVSSIMGRVPPQLGAVVVGLMTWTAIITVTIGTLVKLGETAIEVAQKISLFRSVLGALAGSPALGGKIGAAIDEAAAKLPFPIEKTREWGKALSMVARTGSELKAQLAAVGAASALMGDSGAQAAIRLFEALDRGGAAAMQLVARLKADTPESRAELAALGLKTIDLANALGVTVDQLKRMRLSADQMNAALQKALAKKGRGPIDEMMLTWPVIIGKAKEALLSLFSGLVAPVRGFMGSVQGLFALFAKNTPIMNALRKVATEAFTAIFKFASQAVTAIAKWIRENVTAAKVASTWQTIKSVLSTVWAAAKVGIAIFTALWPVIKIVGTVMLIVAGVALTLAAVFIGVFVAVGGVILAAVGLVVAAVAWIIGALDELINGGQSAGKSFSEGLAGGILGGLAGAVGAALKLAQGVAGVVRGALGIASPSKVMAKMGGQTAEGFEQGVDDGAGAAQGAMKKMAAPPKAQRARAEAGRGGAGASGPLAEFNNCSFFGTTEAQVRAVWQRVLEEMAGEAGAQPQGAG